MASSALGGGSKSVQMRYTKGKLRNMNGGRICMKFTTQLSRNILFALALMLPIQPVMVLAQNPAPQQDAFMRQLVALMGQQQSNDSIAKRAMGNLDSFASQNPILDKAAHTELQIEALAKKLDKTHTSIGSVAFAQSLMPTQDINAIAQRQELLKSFMADAQLHANLGKTLKRVKQSEHALLAYWDPSQVENSSKLFAKADRYYNTILKTLFGDKANNSRWGLEAAMIQQMSIKAWNFLFYIGLQGIAEGFAYWMVLGGRVDVWQWFKNGLSYPIRMVNFWDLGDAGRAYLGKDKDGNNAWTYFKSLNNPNKIYPNRLYTDKDGVTGMLVYNDEEKKLFGVKAEPLSTTDFSGLQNFHGARIYQTYTYADEQPRFQFEAQELPGNYQGYTSRFSSAAAHQALTAGTARARFEVLRRGIDDRSSVGFGFLGKGAKAMFGALAGLKDKFDTNGHLGSRAAHSFFNYFTHWQQAFDAQGDYLLISKANATPGLGQNAFAGLATAAISYYQLSNYYEYLKSSFASVNHIVKTMKELHIHMIHFARIINGAQVLSQELNAHPVLAKSAVAQKLHAFFEKPSSEVAKLLELLAADTFKSENADTQIYSRGNILLAHRLVSRNRDELVPMIQALAELDAYCAMTSTMKELAESKTPFSFVEFSSDDQAMVDMQDAWLPLVHNPVPNDISFGAGKPNKVIITGPNGGGKSVFLKTLGTAVTLAQSWGVAPARSAKMSLFNGIRTSIHPEESLEEELSTFMAEKMRVDDIKDFVFGHNNPNFKVLLLLDEPFRGTVDAESAERIYQFGTDIAPLKQSIVLLATHVEKPTRLAQDTGNAFANYHVCIKEAENGSFEREFKLEPGLLEWWFADAAKRSRFIDFVTMEKHKEKLAKQAAAQQEQQA